MFTRFLASWIRGWTGAGEERAGVTGSKGVTSAANLLEPIESFSSLRTVLSPSQPPRDRLRGGPSSGLSSGSESDIADGEGKGGMMGRRVKGPGRN